MSPFTFKKLHHKFTLLFILLMGLGLGLIGWFAFAATERAVVSSALKQMEKILESTEHHAESFHARARTAMVMALENPVFAEYFSLPETRAGVRFDAAGVLSHTPEQRRIKERMDQWTLSIQRRFPIGETCLVDRSGQEHLRITHGQVAPAAELSPSESGSPFFEPSYRLKPGEVHVTPPYMSLDVKQWVFAYTSPIVLEDGSMPAFLHFEIPVAYFDTVLREVVQPSRSPLTENQLDRLFIATGSGRILVDSTHPINLEMKSDVPPEGPHELNPYLPTLSSVSGSPEFLAIMDGMRRNSEGSGVFDAHGHANYVVFRRLPLFDWSVVIVKSYDRLLEGGSSLGLIRLLILGVCGVVLLAGGVGVWFLVSRITRPLTRISEAMVALEHGGPHQEVPLVGQDELYTMARIFNRMSAEIRAHEAALYQEKNKLTTIIHSAREAILVSDEAGNVVLVNPEAERLLGKSVARIVDEGFLHLVDDPGFLQEFLERRGEGMPETLFYNNRVLNFHAATIQDEAGKNIGSAALIRDVTAEKRLEEKLRQMSFTDKLTGLYNRRWMEDILAREFSRASRHGLSLSVLFFDVDHFKKFNDTYGHDMGDRVLEMIGVVARKGCRKSDIPCRYGGEEFCVILPNTDTEGAAVAAEHLRREVEAMRVDGVRVTTSVGVASYPECPVETPEGLLKSADKALYEGKRAGRNRVMIWTPESEVK